MSLDTKLSEVLRTTKKHLARLDFLGLRTVRDFLTYFPRAYEDRSEFMRISDVQPDRKVTLRGKISNLSSRKSRTGKLMIQALFTDESGSIEVTWFNQPYLKQLLKSGIELILSGKIKYRMGRRTLLSPDFEFLKREQLHTARIIPIYHETEGISSKWIREKMHLLRPFVETFEEYLPEQILQEEKLISYVEALKNIHFPQDKAALKRARYRLAFDELFIIQFLALQRKYFWRKGILEFEKQIKVDRDILKEFSDILSFKFTNAQKRSLAEILRDLERDIPMLRLLQGDVGSGKTIVAAATLFSAVRCGFQGVLMAPTEVLARQHFQDISEFMNPLNISVALLVGSMKEKEKRDIREKLSSGEVDIVIGTHALIQEGISFKHLGLAVIDEQHRFGVAQRDQLKKHGNPHLLNMTATPIPRTLAMTMYGDQDLSIIDEMPPGRQKNITRVVPEHKRCDAYQWISDQVKEGRQVFVICPLIDESDVLEVKSVIAEFEYLSRDVFPDLKLGLLHGKLASDEKALVMRKFALGKIDILVSTSVVEVGVNVPNATIMVIEGAERFGLAQLHQFRGRVGRGEHQSYCFLFQGNVLKKAKDSHFRGNDSVDKVKERLDAMVKYSDGFKLAEIDLNLRGPGEIYGVRQSGIPDLKMATLTDRALLRRARVQAEQLMETDPELKNLSALSEVISGFIEK